MDSAAFDLHYHALQGFLQDEDKIITFKWLSHELGVHVNYAKNLLKTYVNDNQKADGPFTVTYLLYGRLHDAQKLECCLVVDHTLADKRTQFEQILWEHVYSIQKKVSSVDPDLLYIVNKSISGNCLGAVGYENDIQKRTGRYPVVPKVESKPTSITSDVIEKPKHNSVEKKKSISNMFQVQPKKEKEPERNTNENTKTTTEKEKQVAKRGIASFFNKPSTSLKTNSKTHQEKATEVIPKEEVKDKKTNDEIKEKISYNALIDTDDEVMEVAPPSKQKDVKRTKNASKKRSRSKSVEKQTNKKHKRIVQYHQSDSSEDDMFAPIRSPEPSHPDDDDDDVIPPTPVSDNIPVNNSNNKRRKRKLVERTYQDDEGYMVTKKEYVMETDSDEDIEKPVPVSSGKTAQTSNSSIVNNANKIEQNGKSKKKTTSPKKQKTLMAFFQKH